VFFDTLRVFLFPLFFKFLVSVAAIYANKGVYIRQAINILQKMMHVFAEQ